MIRLAEKRWFVYDGTMKDGPNIVGIAALIGDHARAEVLTALMADRALTATELAEVGGVTKQTISAHLAKLVDAGLVAVEIGVRIYESLLKRRALVPGAKGLALTAAGRRLFQELRIDTDVLSRQKRAFCRACLDWSERRHHLAGALGAALLARFVDLGWAKRARDSRVVLLTANGERALHKMFDAHGAA